MKNEAKVINAKKRREEQQLEQEKAVGAEADASGQKEEAALTFASQMIEEPNSKAARLLVPGTIIESVDGNDITMMDKGLALFLLKRSRTRALICRRPKVLYRLVQPKLLRVYSAVPPAPPSAAAMEEAQCDDSVAAAAINCKKTRRLLRLHTAAALFSKGSVVEVCALKVVAEVAYLKLRSPPASLFGDSSSGGGGGNGSGNEDDARFRLSKPEAWIKAETHTERTKIWKNVPDSSLRESHIHHRDIRKVTVNRFDGAPLLSMPVLHLSPTEHKQHLIFL